MEKSRIFLWFPFLIIFLLISPAFSLTLTRGPYIQNLQPGSAVVIWKTDEATTGSEVQYGLTSVYTHNATDPTLGIQHSVNLTGLDEGTIYHYQVKSGGETLTGELTFHSAKGPGFDSFVFVAMGDHRTNPTTHTLVADRVELIDPEIVIDSGDLVSDGNVESNWDPQFFTPEKDVMSRTCFFPSIGNH